MSSKQQDVAKPAISPILFMTVEGQPMAFYLRPGPAKSKLQPLITAGAGLVYNVQQPGAILLIDPEEKDDIPEATAHRYVSTQYIVDCIEKDEQLNLEDYRVKSEAAPRQSARLSNKSTSPRYSGGRIGYTPEDDAAILSYVSNHKTGVGGNRLWQEMEKQRVTSHSWQSMKYRYRVRLAKKTPEVVVAVTVEEDNKEADGEIKDEGTDEAVSRGNSTAEDSSSETHSPETNLTQADSKSESVQPEITEAQASVLPQVQYVDRQEDEQSAESPQTDDVDPQTDEERAESSQTDNVDPQTDEEQAESSQEETVEPETSISPQTGPSLDPQTNSHPAEDTEPEEQTITSPKKQRVQQSSPPAEAESLLDTSPQTRSKEKKKASLEPEQPQRSLRRKRSVLDMLCLPESYSKKLRSPPGRPPSPPPPTKKTKLSVKPSPQKVTVVDEPPPKKARAKSVKAAAEREQAAVSETTQADPEPDPEPGQEPDPEPNQEPDPEPDPEPNPEPNPEPGQEPDQDPDQEPGQEPDPEPNQEPEPQPQKVEKKKEKRKLGILELATKEFEDEDESDEDESPDLLNPTEMGTVQPTAAELPLPAAAAASTQSHPEHRGPVLQENHQASCSKSLPETSGPEPTATGATDVTSKVHLFIFDSESQEEESQSILGAKPVVNKDAAPSLTQVQLEEDKQRIRELMSQTKQDLVSVTKALLRTSGDFSAALEQLLNPSSASGTVWNRHDDDLLLSADPMDREQLQEKYGEEGVAKRIVFLEIVT